ncbi:MAG: hypothetical protein RL026_2786 [Pseudomonadota bacterium]|jgi:cation diffusion facilitator family transporter
MATPQPTHATSRSHLGSDHARNERRTWAVVALTGAMMAAEIVGGTWFGSIALVADGWHMATHAAALGVAAMAYRFARRHADNPVFTFGTGNVGELAGFASAVVLLVVALLIAWESLQRLWSPTAIDTAQALAIATLGLLVNLASAALLHHGHEHGHGHAVDSNLRAAYLHVLADALTSVLAIGGLLAARFLGWLWVDPLIGIVGAAVILHWSLGLARQAARSLLNAHDTLAREALIVQQLTDPAAGEHVRDLRLWRLGPGKEALLVRIESARPLPPAAYKARLANIEGLAEITIEVNPATAQVDQR